ncbi:MAG: glycosyltransferase family A protein [Planctomycetota bacterium]|nr:glycosyltransferase family A protein [Planctomycetota bacterium]
MPQSVTNNPRVSVVIPTHNRPELTLRAIGSAQTQTLRDLEVIVVDDGSTDHTWQSLLSIQEQDSRVSLVQQTSQGANSARNRGVSHAKASHVLFLDSDDELIPNAIESLITNVASDKIAVVCGGAETVDDTGHFLETRYPRNLGPAYENQNGLFLAGTYLVRRDVLIQCGGFDPECQASQHKDLALRLVPHCVASGQRIATIADVTVRVHAHSGNHLRSNLAALLDARLHALRVHEQQLKKSPRHHAIYCETAAIYAAKLRRFSVARELFRQALSSLPQKKSTYLRYLVAHVPLLRRAVWKP